MTASDDARFAALPDFVLGPVSVFRFDGGDDDLLTGGWGATGLSAGPDPLPPDASSEVLRRHALAHNYRGLIDVSEGGGYGRFFGPTVGGDVGRDGRIPGREYRVLADDGSGAERVALMVQVPDGFSPESGGLVAAASSGSRGIYGAVGVVGEWALKRGLAVAYTDKGTGVGVHDLDRDRSVRLDGALAVGDDSHTLFRVHSSGEDMAGEDMNRYRAAFPGRVAVKHAHSRRNPERRWGHYLLRAVRFAFYVLNRPEIRGAGPVLTPARLPVIAAGISNGGAAALRAAEADREGLIRAVVASEPNVQPRPEPELVLRQGDRTWRYPAHSRSLLDVHTLFHLYQPVINLAPDLATAPFNLLDPILCDNRRKEMIRLGILPQGTAAESAAAAGRRLAQRGILPDSDILAPAHCAFGVSEAIAVTYASAYGRFGVTESVAGYGVATLAPDLTPQAPDSELLRNLFAAGAGIPPMPARPLSEAQMAWLTARHPEMTFPAPPVGGLDWINEHSRGGPRLSRYSISPWGVMDLNLRGALALRGLATGRDFSGAPLSGSEAEAHERVAAGIAEVRATGDIGDRPAIIVHGRADAVLPPNHAARPYFGLHRMVAGARGRLRYLEVAHAHHMDAFNALPGFDARFVPLHLYLVRALDRMWDHLRGRGDLPPDQVIRARPRGVDEAGAVPPLSDRNVPGIAADPPEADRIRFSENTVWIPE
ncbi:MAG: 3-hydroxybutyrate oligomer hydrolase family protein [Desulfococcaceae bacterium]